MEMVLTTQLQEILTNHSMILSVISYKNLTNFLPRMYFERNLWVAFAINVNLINYRVIKISTVPNFLEVTKLLVACIINKQLETSSVIGNN